MNRHSRRSAQGRQFQKIETNALNQTHCAVEDKIAYSTRAHARQARNRLGPGLSIYICGTHFHIGHHGDLTRDEHRKHRDG